MLAKLQFWKRVTSSQGVYWCVGTGSRVFVKKLQEIHGIILAGATVKTDMARLDVGHGNSPPNPEKPSKPLLVKPPLQCYHEMLTDR